MSQDRQEAAQVTLRCACGATCIGMLPTWQAELVRLLDGPQLQKCPTCDPTLRPKQQTFSIGCSYAVPSIGQAGVKR